MDDSVCPRVPVNATRTRICFKDLSAAEESVFTFRLWLAERNSETPFGKSLTSKSCERICVKFAAVQGEVVSESKGLELTSIVPTNNTAPTGERGSMCWIIMVRSTAAKASWNDDKVLL